MFVGIHFQQPVAGRGIDCGIAPRPFQFERPFDQATGAESCHELGRNRRGGVAAPIEHDHRFIGKTQPFQTGAQPLLFIVDAQQRRQSGPTTDRRSHEKGVRSRESKEAHEGEGRGCETPGTTYPRDTPFFPSPRV